MKAYLTRPLATQQINYLPDYQLVYLNNPKAGCSTVKASLWKSYDENKGLDTFQDANGIAHDVKHTPFLRSPAQLVQAGIDKFLDATFFSVVRNPYTRVLSAYLEKTGSDGNDPNVWKGFCRRYEINPDLPKKQFPFKLFLRLLSYELPELLDPHFRPQAFNILYPFIDYDYIGHLENMSEVFTFLQEHQLAEAERQDGHKTSASDKLAQYYDAEAIEIAYQLYQVDFELFGYDKDINQLANVRPAQRLSQGQRAALGAFIKAYFAPPAQRLGFIQKLKAFFPQDYCPLCVQFELSQNPLEKLVLAEQVLSRETKNWLVTKQFSDYFFSINNLTAGMVYASMTNYTMNRHKHFLNIKYL